jgi:hypothetical protein
MIERSFGVLKMKWRILLKMPKYLITKQSKLYLLVWPFTISSETAVAVAAGGELSNTVSNILVQLQPQLAFS